MAPPSLLAHLDSSKDSAALSLAYASIGDEGCNSIARYMRENVMLKTVDLRGNSIRADGLVVLAHALRSTSNIGSVCLKWNHVGSHERGVQALSDVLKVNRSISHVDLRNNKLGPEAGRHLGAMLKENGTLTHLDISWNDIGPEGGKQLLEGLQANHSLIDCQLSGNRIAEDTLHAIAFILRRNRQGTPMSAPPSAKDTNASEPVLYSQASPGSTLAGPQSNGVGLASASPNGSPSRTRDFNASNATQPPGVINGNDVTAVGGRLAVEDDGLKLKLLHREQNYSNAEDARFFGEVAEYIDLLQLDVARNRKYRVDAEEREKVVTKGFMEREMRYAQEMRELENLLAKAKADKDELIHDTQYLQTEISRVKQEKANTNADRMKLEEIAQATSDRLRSDIRDGLAVKADVETQIFKVKRRQQEQEEENARLRTYLSKCKEDLDRALR